MSETPPQATITISLSELTALIRQAVHEEFEKHAHRLRPPILDDWDQEGPDDPEGDAELLAEALKEHEHYRLHPETLTDWEDFKAELKLAEERGELPD